MKVCKFEKIKDEDDIKQVIYCIRQEHTYVAVLPVLTQLLPRRRRCFSYLS